MSLCIKPTNGVVKVLITSAGAALPLKGWAMEPVFRRRAVRCVPQRLQPCECGSMRFGLDFGTSNTSIAVWDGERSTVLPIDPLAGAAMPTVLYVRRDGSSVGGRAPH